MIAALTHHAGTAFICLSLLFLLGVVIADWRWRAQQKQRVKALLDIWERPETTTAQREIIEGKLAKIYRATDKRRHG